MPILFCAVALEYQDHEHKDCLVRNDLHSLRSNVTTNNCVEWCDNNNSSCAGFTLYKNTCYFKSYDCENDLRNAGSSKL